MFAARLAATGFTIFSSFAAFACNVKPEMLRGSWEALSRAGFFRQMELSIENGQSEFNSWRHERPEVTGATWTLEKCTLRISKPSDPSMSFAYAVSMKGRQHLELREPGQPVARYRRVKQ